MLIRRSCRLAVVLAAGAMSLVPAAGAVAATRASGGPGHGAVPATRVAPLCLVMPKTAGCDQPLVP
jgi:hypothetical protein